PFPSAATITWIGHDHVAVDRPRRGGEFNRSRPRGAVPARYCPAVQRAELVEILRRYKFGVVATVSVAAAPQAATVGIAVGDELELVFDTLTTTRKHANLAHEARVAVVLGEGEVTVQLEGIADEPRGAELARIQAIYFATFPDGRERAGWNHITWIRVKPTWARVSDYTQDPPAITEVAL
ncbi:MAG: pyridoxamine 5'-phosphate oxidase family protein, partial [Kofleriaceae bacterium]